MELGSLSFWISACLMSGLLGKALVLELWHTDPLRPEAHCCLVLRYDMSVKRSSLAKHLQAVSDMLLLAQASHS